MKKEKKLEEVVSNTYEKKFLYLGELSLGTKIYDDRAMDGLVEFIKDQKINKKIDGVIINGGILPYIPNYYGIQNSEEMRFLGNDKNKELSERSIEALNGNLSKKDKEYITNFVAQKITNMGEAVDLSRREISKLNELLTDIEIHYIQGEEDIKNIKGLKEIKINDYKRFRKNLGTVEEKCGKIQKELDESNLEKDLYNYEKDILKKLKKILYVKDSEELVNNKLNKFIKENNEILNELNENGSNRTELNENEFGENNILNFLTNISSKKQVFKRLNQINTSIESIKEKIKDRELKIRQYELQVNAMMREKEAAGFFSLTKRKQINADEEELLFRLAKNEYNSLIYNIFDSYRNFHVHSGFEIDITLKGIDFCLAHSSSNRSYAPILTDIKNAKQRNHALNKTKTKVPDIYLTAHGKGGFRVQPQPKKSEPTQKKDHSYGKNFRKTPKYCFNIKLPAFQSIKKLAAIRKKGLKNWHVSRFEANNYASGAVIHTIYPNKINEFEFISVDELINYKKNETIKENELVKGSTMSDSHIGCPNAPGRPSNYDILEASKKVIKEYSPKLIVLNGDIIHGSLEKHFGSNEQYLALPPVYLDEKVNQVINSILSDKEKIEVISYLNKVFRESIPITNVSKQKVEFKKRLVPFLQNFIEESCQIILVSGNHYNETSKFFDEATDLSTLLDAKYLDSKDLHVVSAFGEKYGVGELDLDFGSLYVAHSPGRGPDQVLGGMNKLLNSNRNSRLAIFGHTHHCGIGFGDGTFIVSCPGMQPWSPYVDNAGLYPGPRGLINFEIHENKEYMKWQFVLEDSLEHLNYLTQPPSEDILNRAEITEIIEVNNDG
ncbi:hypothetical protein HOK51_06575 [Candidatus Woesearchaeota archaeon]|jgi:hypothetical protein|nr:hypothetical protein [Candidatus Woesearchaeota archaeon]MBT6519489.1 hypothetical protein [Candidatus Woesearchaeota archaeon]MBT7368237.1 hypothetical protein [Candidatus Woesearchaeota archaeon]